MLSAPQPIARPSRPALPDPIPALAPRIGDMIRAHGHDEPRLCEAVARALTPVVANADWLWPCFRVPAAAGYRRERLFEAPDGRFSIGCFVWGPGQRTPIHDHRAWGVIGVAAGTLKAVTYFPTAAGGLAPGAIERVGAGECSWLHPAGGDIHQIGGADEATAISIHVYGCRFDEVCRRRYRPDGTELKP